MNPIYKKLFDTYGDTVLREYGVYDEDEIDESLEKLPIDKATLVNLNNLFFRYYYRWSTDAFTLGLHLGLNLLEEQVSASRPQGGPVAPTSSSAPASSAPA